MGMEIPCGVRLASAKCMPHRPIFFCSPDDAPTLLLFRLLAFCRSFFALALAFFASRACKRSGAIADVVARAICLEEEGSLCLLMWR